MYDQNCFLLIVSTRQEKLWLYTDFFPLVKAKPECKRMSIVKKLSLFYLVSSQILAVNCHSNISHSSKIMRSSFGHKQEIPATHWFFHENF